MSFTKPYIAALRGPADAQAELAERVRTLRLRQNMTQAELAVRAGLSIGAVRHFERTGEIRLSGFLRIVMAQGRMMETQDWLKLSDTPISLFTPRIEKPLRQRARRSKCG